MSGQENGLPSTRGHSDVAVREVGSRKSPDQRRPLFIKLLAGFAICGAIFFCYFFFKSPDLGCDSARVKNILGQMVKKGLKQEVGAYGRVVGGDPGDIQDIIDKVDITVDQIVTRKETAKGCACQAVVTMAAPKKAGSTFAVNYTTSYAANKEIYVELDANTLLGKLIYGGKN